MVFAVKTKTTISFCFFLFLFQYFCITDLLLWEYKLVLYKPLVLTSELYSFESDLRRKHDFFTSDIIHRMSLRELNVCHVGSSHNSLEEQKQS